MEPTNPTPTPGGNNGKIAGVVIVIILIALVVWYFTSGRSKKDTKSGTETTQDQLAAESPKSLKELLALGKSQKCTYSEANNQGMFYFADGKMRGDFEATENGQAMTTHMIRADGYQYVWVGGQGGLKIKEADLKKFETQANQGNNQTPDLNERVNYTCQNWSGDSAKFAVPTDVEFNDFGALFEGLGMPVPGNENIEETIVTDETPGAGAQCAVCNQLPAGDQRNACLQALGC